MQAKVLRFQHTAARRRLGAFEAILHDVALFQHTAARRRLAFVDAVLSTARTVSTHSRPKAAGRLTWQSCHKVKVSTHSRPKAAGTAALHQLHKIVVSTHSRPKAAGCITSTGKRVYTRFQHTAARRRLGPIPRLRGQERRGFNTQPPEGGWGDFVHLNVKSGVVSTHSRPKAAGANLAECCASRLVSTHSRPKAAGGSHTLIT